MPVNAVLNRADVLRAQPPRQRQPDADGHEIDRRRAAQIEVQAGQHEEALRQQPEQHRADAIGDAIDDDVDGVLDRGPIAGRNRQVEELVGRLVDGEPQPLIEAVGEQHAPECRRQQDEEVAGRHRQRQRENGRRHAPVAKHAPGDQQLHEKAAGAGDEAEQAVELGDVGGAGGEMLLGDHAQLQRGPLRRDRDGKDDAREQPQVRAGDDLPPGRGEGPRDRPPSPAQSDAADAQLGGQDDRRRRRDQQRQHQQQVDRAADRLDEHPREHARGHRAQRRAGANQAEQPLRLARVEQRVGEAPRLDRGNDAVAAHPHIKDVRQPAERVKAEQIPEQQDVEAEPDERRHGDRARPEPGRDPRVERHEQREHQRHRRIHVDQIVGLVLTEKEPAADWLGEQKRGDDDPDVKEGQKDGQSLAGPDVQEPTHAMKHGPAQFTSGDASLRLFSPCPSSGFFLLS